MKYRIRDIENFVTTANCVTIVQAAKLLGMGQPSLSESLKRLEQDHGALLFYRSRTGIQLNPEGRSFLSLSQKALQSLQDLDLAQQAEGAVFGQRIISIGCHPMVAQYTIPKALSILKKKAHDFRIELRHDLSRVIQMEIQKGRIDLGIVINPIQVPDLIIKSLGSDVVSVWSHKLDFPHDTIICNPNLNQTQYILKRWKNKPQKIISTDSLELICQMVAEGIGYGIIPGRAVQLSKPTLKRCASLPSFDDEIALVYRPEFGKIPAEKLLIESLKEIF